MNPLTLILILKDIASGDPIIANFIQSFIPSVPLLGLVLKNPNLINSLKIPDTDLKKLSGVLQKIFKNKTINKKTKDSVVDELKKTNSISKAQSNISALYETQEIDIWVNLSNKSTALQSGIFIPIYEQNSDIYGIANLIYQKGKGTSYSYPNVSLSTWSRMISDSVKGGRGANSIFVSEYLRGGRTKKQSRAEVKKGFIRLENKVFKEFKSVKSVFKDNIIYAKQARAKFAPLTKKTKNTKAKGVR